MRECLENGVVRGWARLQDGNVADYFESMWMSLSQKPYTAPEVTKSSPIMTAKKLQMNEDQASDHSDM
jgi:hypothetical protein